MADKDYSVKIGVDVELDTETARKELKDFKKELQSLLSGAGDLKFAVGGYGESEVISSGYAEALKKSVKKNMAANKDWEDSFDTLDDAVEASFEGIIETLQSTEMEMKREMNNLAERYAKMLGIDFVANIAESLGEQDFALPTAKMSESERKQATQDFIPAGDKVIYSPAAFISAIENLAQRIPFAEFPNQRIPVKGAGVDKVSFRDAASFGKDINLGGPLNSLIPEISDDIKESIFNLMDRATDQGKSDAVGNFLRQKIEDLLTEIFKRGYSAREATFKRSGGSEGEDSVENLIRYADSSARAAIAQAEEEFGLATGTFAKSVKIISDKLTEENSSNTEIAKKLQEMDRMAGGTGEGSFIKGQGGRQPSSPQAFLNALYGDYNDMGTGTLMSTPDPRGVPDLMAQIFNNPAIIASGKEGIQGLMEDLGKFIKPDAVPDFDVEAYKRGLAQQKEEVEASGRQFLLAFDTEFNDKLPQKFTEASISIKDAAGKFMEVFGFVQKPPSSEYGDMLKGSFGANKGKPEKIMAASAKDLEERAKLLNENAKKFDLESIIPEADLGAKDFQTNFKQFYAKMSQLTAILKAAAELEIPVAGSAIQTAEFSRLDKVIKTINETIVKLGLELPKLEMPINQLLFDTQKIIDNAEKAGSPTAKALMAPTLPTGFGERGDEPLRGAGVENLIRNLVGQFPAQLGANLERIELKPGGGFKIDGLDAHFARADNQAVLIITEAMAKFEDLVGFMQTKIATDYQPKKTADKQMAVAEQAAGGGGGGLDSRRTAGGDAEGARKRFLTEKELLPLLKDLTALEQKQVLVGLDRLNQTKEYKALIETERVIRQNILTLEEKLKTATTKEEKRTALKDLIAEKSLLEQLTAAGKKLETQKRDEIKLNIRGKDVKDKDLQTTSKQIDEMNRLRSTTSGVGREIVGQLKEQAAAAKAVETQTKSLVNTWVTGRYALYDVGNAYAEVSRQLWMFSRQIFNVTQSYRSYETAFTSVERSIEPLAATLAGAEEESRSLKNAFIDLSEEIPVSFEDIARIATLGAQMGVAASGIVDFTKTVSQFSSVTGVAADTVAQKFGRIAELANVDYSEFNNLGSAILFAGINAVATEPEIMTLSESIAAVSAQAGMIPAEIVGMATALASTGIQAEQARGVFTRVFADIDRAVSKGGDSLNALASVAGMSAEDFSKAWGTEGASYDVFRAILGGLNSTEDLTSAFDKLNIVETREINTLTRLAKNLNVVDQAISDANQSFESGTFLNEAFGKTVDNLDSQIQMFNNNVKALGEAISGSMAGMLLKVIPIVNEFLQILKEVAKNPIAGGITAGALGITAFGAAATLAVSGVAKLVAQIYAFRVAAINTANDATVVSGIPDMLKQLTGFGGGIIEMRDSLKSIDPGVRGIITPTTFGLFDSMEERKNTLLRQDNIYLAGSKARSAAAVTAARLEADSITQIVAARNQQLAQIEMLDGVSAQEKINMAQAIGGRQISVITINGETRALSANEIAELKNTAASASVSAAKRQEAAERLKLITVINTETKAASMAGRGVLGMGAGMVGLATTLGTVLAVGTGIAAIFGVIAASVEASKINILESGGGLASLRDAIKQDTLEYQKLTDEQRKGSNEFALHTVQVEKNTASLDPNAQAIAKVTGLSSDYADKNKVVTASVDSQTFAIGRNTREWLANAMMQDKNLQELTTRYPNFFSDLESMGLNFQDLLNQIIEDPANAANPVAGMANELRLEIERLQSIVTGYDLGTDDLITPEEVRAARDRIAELNTELTKIGAAEAIFDSLKESLGGALASNEIFNAIRGVLGLNDALDETGETAEGLNNVAKALRTVLDYAGDLAGILSRVVELNFGRQIAVDGITSGWLKLSDSAKDAQDAIKAANNEIKGLTADRSILEYQLSVAERYGDEVRAAKIRAELAKVNGQIADSEEKLADAESQASTELDGNSEAAIRNRASLLGMVSEYQSYIEMLAKLGKKQPELTKESAKMKKEFIAQAKALGFTEEQIADYVDIFDDFAETATNAPRDVDIEVKLGLTAAEQAILEFTSKNRSTSVKVDADTEDAEDDVDDLLNKINKSSPDAIKLERINTLAADGSLESWLELEREFGAPKVTGITADAADRKIKDWLNLQRILLAPRIESINTLVADGSLKSWLILERYFGAPKVTDITADAADRKIRDWLGKERTIAAARFAVPHTLAADNAINVWLNKGREISVSVKFKSSEMVSSQATAALNVARQFPVNSTHYNSYIEMYRELNKVASQLRSNGMAAGGLVTGPGSGTSDSIPTMLSNGEYVVKANAVKTYGVDFFNALNQQRMGFAPVSGGRFNGQQQQGPTIVFLSPEDRQLLRQFGDRPVNLYADSTKIAEVANSGNTKMSRRGTR